MFGFEQLDVWRRSLNFANAMFEVADGLPKHYQFSLGDQLRRASLSIPTNIAEGSGRDGGKEQAYFYGVAKGSLKQPTLEERTPTQTHNSNLSRRNRGPFE